MPVVAIIGVDEAGKTTLIEQLKEKYDLDVLAFPTPRLRAALAELTIDYTDIHSILNYHMRFQLDFLQQSDLIGEYILDDRLLILDRFIYCSLAYLRHAVLKYHDIMFWKKYTRPILWGLYRQLNRPMLTLWLKRNNLEDLEHQQIQDCYQEELEDFNYHTDFIEEPEYLIRYEPIKALQPDTFSQVEKLLKKKGYLE